MSADLFAEFNSPPASSSTPTPANNLRGGQAKPQPQSPSTSQNVLDASTGHHGGATSQPMPSWSSFQSSSNSMSDWTQPTTQQWQPPRPQAADDDDGWGDFEVADQTSTSGSAALPAPNSIAHEIGNWASHVTSSNTQQSRQEISQGFKSGPMAHILLDLGSNGFQQAGIPQHTWPQPEPKKKLQIQATPSDPNVLFDADDFELQGGGEDDDGFDEFGDFEAAEPTPSPKAVSPAAAVTSNMDLLGLDDPPVDLPVKDTREQAHAKSNAMNFGAMSTTDPQSTNPFPPKTQTQPSKINLPQPAASKPKATLKSSSTITNTKVSASSTADLSKATAEEDDWAAWDDFTGSGADNSVAHTPVKTTATIDAGQGWDSHDEKQTCTPVKVDDNTPPPMNIPPPAILLSAFPELFGTGDSLFKQVTGQSTTIKQKILSSPKAVGFLQGYILIATTAARIIAGRKHRWHRDKILAKSMSISAAGSKGMKLAGVDKTQSIREDREAADVVVTWKEYVGKLRSAVAATNSAAKTNLKVPELIENPQIQTAKKVPTAAKPCIICGLKREERVPKVDFDVEDSFGEWWVDHWGHRACKNFWIEHEAKLRQR